MSNAITLLHRRNQANPDSPWWWGLPPPPAPCPQERSTPPEPDIHAEHKADLDGVWLPHPDSFPVWWGSVGSR